MKKSRILKTAADIVDAFGGTKEAAEWAGVGESAVSNWIARGFVPPGWHYRMQEHFQGLGVMLSPSAFGQTKKPYRSRQRSYQSATA